MILVFIVLFLAVGCSSETQTGLSDSDVKDSTLDPEFSGGPVTENSMDQDYLPNCLSIQDSMFQQMCAAVGNHNIKMCDDVKNSNANEQKYHQSMCKAWVAAANKDPKLCKSFQEGKELIVTEFGCLDLVARASRDKKVCDMISIQNGKNGCLYDVDVMLGKAGLSGCKDSACVYDYAWRNDDKSACEKFGDVTTAFLLMHKASCLAMLSGNLKLCDPLKSEGVDNWNFCKIKSQYKKMMSGGSNFDFTLCKKDDECIKTVMLEMILEMTR